MTEAARPFRIRVIDHVVLRVVDLAAMVDFYERVLGCRLERGPGGIRLAQLRAGDSLIDLVEAGGPLDQPDDRRPELRARNMDHFCVQIEPWNVGAIVAHLAVHGVRHGEVEQRYGALGTGPSIYLQDPEGNTVELKGAPTEPIG